MAEAATSQIRIDVQSTGVERATAAIDKLVSSEAALVRITDSVTKVRQRNETAIDRIARKFDAEYRATQDVERATAQLNRARDAGLGGTEAYARATAALSKSQNDNAKISALQAHQWLNLSRQGQDVFTMLAMGASPLQVITSQGAQIYDVFASGRGGATAALKEFGVVATKALFSPIGIAASLAASIAAVSFEAGKAQKTLAELAAQSRNTGLSAETLQGGKVVGAGVGLDEKASLAAFGNAGKQFEAYGRNSGPVLSTLQQVDKSFIGVVDKARSAGEFVGLLNEEIARLPVRQAEQLATALYGDEAAKRLLDSIRAGEVSMRTLNEASGATGQSLGQSASAAEQMQNRIAEAAAVADAKLLVATRNIKSPTDDIKLGWYSVVGAIADAVTQSEKLQRTMSAMTSWSALFKEIGKGYDALDKALGARPISSLQDEARSRMAAPGEIPFPNFQDAKQGFLPKLTNPSVGATRKLFEKPDKPHGGKSATEQEADTYQKITRELEGQIRLASTLGVEHDKISLQLKIQAEQAKLGANASAEHKSHIAELVTQLDEAQRAQEKITESAKAMRDAYAGVANPLAGGLKSVLMGKSKPGDALNGVLETLQGSVFDAALTGSGPLSALFGTQGKDGAMGGIFGGIFEGITGALGGGANAKDMNVTAKTVNVNGKGGAAGAIGSALGGGGGAMGMISSGVGDLISSLFGSHAAGGFVGSASAHMRAPITAFIGAPHFASGGAVPGSSGPVPIIAHAGELILNAAQQHNTAAAISRGRNDNRAAPVTVNLIGAPQGTKVQETRDSSGGRRIDIVVDERVAAAMGSPQGVEAAGANYGMSRRVARR